MNYRGITYPGCLSYRPILWLWEKLFCPKEIHLFDEVWTADDHYLYCDACGLMVFIDEIWNEAEYEEIQFLYEN